MAMENISSTEFRNSAIKRFIKTVSPWAFVFLSILVLGFIFTSTIKNLSDRWFEPDSIFAHGPLVPIISAWMVWRRRERLFEAKGSPGLLPILSLAFFLGIHEYFFAIGFNSGASIAMVGSIWSIVGCLFGWAGVRILAVPLCYLFLMIPFPSFLISRLTFDLRELSTSISAIFLSQVLSGFERIGNVFTFGNNEVVISDACSGLRTLVTGIATAGVLAELEENRKRGFLLFLYAVPATVLANSVRIILYSFGVALGYSEFVNGIGHEWIGIFTFLISLVLMLVFVRIMPLVRHGTNRAVSSRVIKQGLSTPKLNWSLSFSLLVTVVIAGVAHLVNQSNSQAIAFDSRAELRTKYIPTVIGHWKSEDVIEDRETLESLYSTRDLFMRAYFQDDTQVGAQDYTKEVYLYVIHADEGRKVAHPPEICYRAEGYELTERGETAFTFGNSTQIDVNRSVFDRPNHSLLVYHWFRINGVDTSSYLSHQLRFLFNRPEKNLGSSMYRISTPILNGDVEKAESMIRAFSVDVMPSVFSSMNPI